MDGFNILSKIGEGSYSTVELSRTAIAGDVALSSFNNFVLL